MFRRKPKQDPVAKRRWRISIGLQIARLFVGILALAASFGVGWKFGQSEDPMPDVAGGVVRPEQPICPKVIQRGHSVSFPEFPGVSVKLLDLQRLGHFESESEDLTSPAFVGLELDAGDMRRVGEGILRVSEVDPPRRVAPDRFLEISAGEWRKFTADLSSSKVRRLQHTPWAMLEVMSKGAGHEMAIRFKEDTLAGPWGCLLVQNLFDTQEHRSVQLESIVARPLRAGSCE